MGTAQAGRGDPALGDRSMEDDMAEGDLGDGMGARAPRGGDDLLAPPPQARLCEQVGGGGAMLDPERDPRWRRTGSEGSAGESGEVLRRRLQEVTEEVEVLRTELEVTRRHLEGKHEALRILQGQAILDRATGHTKVQLQRSEERARALEKEANALQWEITFDRVQFKNVERTWELRYERACTENTALRKALDERLEELQDVRRENSSLSQQCLELLGLLSFQERRDFQKTRPPPGGEGSALELAVYGACQCSSCSEPCSCARSAAASRSQVLQLQQELELQTGRRDEAYVMVDAFRIAFEQQLRRGSEKVLRLAEGETPRATPRQTNPDRGKLRASGVAQKLRRFLPLGKDGDALSDPKGTLQLLLDLLSDKEEALAHQRKVSYMLARSSEELEKRLQAQITAEPPHTDPGPTTEGVDQEGEDQEGVDQEGVGQEDVDQEGVGQEGVDQEGVGQEGVDQEETGDVDQTK